jgi:light-regulated signal transduction histidine kinase (bacteriophytochrome)
MSVMSSNKRPATSLSYSDSPCSPEELLRSRDKEFQEFILSVAHDLRGPLGNVSTYCELLTQHGGEYSAEEKDQFRRFILDGTARMRTLMDGIVEYAAADTENGRFLAVNMNGVFRDAMMSLAAQSGSRQVTVTLGPLPVVWGDFDSLVKVVRHLLDNAARYCHKPPSRADVSCRREGADWLFTVQDNGPGIDPDYHAQIFLPFKRLHGRQIAGNGLGLAFCRKAIELHGGRLWIESKRAESGPGQGATFLFTLPAILPEHESRTAGT